MKIGIKVGVKGEFKNLKKESEFLMLPCLLTIFHLFSQQLPANYLRCGHKRIRSKMEIQESASLCQQLYPAQLGECQCPTGHSPFSQLQVWPGVVSPVGGAREAPSLASFTCGGVVTSYLCNLSFQWDGSKCIDSTELFPTLTNSSLRLLCACKLSHM